ncbi:hypothetical protein GIB67_038094 [Kingdonia uniflora]|uniref:Uncharacterized protein n=1 Tax=Kingdonia uniflora TaxID=39325 RepID=A0A7J7P850_9MAGN|nr:hypothetical protein GIB67_038094 [Kingdonia uniflora]
MALSWKAFRYKIKLQYYKNYNTDEERLASIPPRVEPNQWPTLVRYWGLKKTQGMAQKNSDNRANLTCHPRTGRRTFARRTEDNEPIDDLSIYRSTQCIGNDLYNAEDGLAEREETIRRRLLELPEEERETNIEARDNIFKDVIGEDGHGRVLCKGVVARPKNARSRSSSLSFQNYEDELSKLQREADEREARHQ